jgi:3-oxoacyl-[acyl-carrier-protein] synthase II
MTSLVNNNGKHRVVITGIGVITPVGNDTKTNWCNLINGVSGISVLDEQVPLYGYPYRVAGLVRNEKQSINAVISEKNQTKTDRFIQLAVVAGHEAMTSAGLNTMQSDNCDRFGCYLGVGLGGLGSLSEAVLSLEAGHKKVSPFVIPRSISNEAVNWLSMTWNLRGPSAAIATACASSSDALGMAFRLIRDGYCDYMLAGGSESCVVPIGIVAFGNMRTLSTWAGDPIAASRPFDRLRSGFVIAEGAAMLVLERYDLALARDAQIYAEIVGYGSAADAYHITAMHPDGFGAVAAITSALSDAQIIPSDIGYINAHGTATQMNDVIETQVIKKVFGDYVKTNLKEHVVISSTKSMTGHMLGAAGAVELAYTALAVHYGILPPTINLTDPDPQCDLDYIPLYARTKAIDYALSNSFGFGGQNATVIIKKI